MKHADLFAFVGPSLQQEARDHVVSRTGERCLVGSSEPASGLGVGLIDVVDHRVVKRLLDPLGVGDVAGEVFPGQ
ncbi:MAG: hypothetical protein JWR85_264 [Marmoricola sp.]|nr:hypothetical protein [Marmoricola sp.]